MAAIATIAINIHRSTVHHQRPNRLVSVRGSVVICQLPCARREGHRQDLEKLRHEIQNHQTIRAVPRAGNGLIRSLARIPVRPDNADAVEDLKSHRTKL